MNCRARAVKKGGAIFFDLIFFLSFFYQEKKKIDTAISKKNYALAIALRAWHCLHPDASGRHYNDWLAVPLLPYG